MSTMDVTASGRARAEAPMLKGRPVPLAEAVALARRFILGAIAEGANVTTGHGHGPLNHGHAPVATHVFKRA